ncbi:MAG: arylamine N-acetyltransferase [Lachnospiraceae bacterium]|jgi:N-hydroxyarylamine O-acetyltransferase|nr:arylamine N-acetyltransferase [Lachnospiraceae bacterium]
MDLKAYYERLGIERPAVLDKAALDKIIQAHQCSIPFEDLECNYLKKKVLVDTDSLFNKIITNKRGGYCFELNGLFKHFLEETGFDVFSVFCRVRSFDRPVMHRGNFIRFSDGLYFADVGFGGPMPYGCVKLEDGLKQDIFGETFWFEKADDYWWNLKRLNEEGETESVLYMTTQPQPDIEFEAMNYFCCTNPEGRFVTLTLVNLRRPDGYYSITDREFKSKVGDRVEERTLTTDEEFRETLSKYFGINL